MILVVDNYDSFTFNLVQALQAAGANVKVVRNDAIDRAGLEALADDPDSDLRGIVISPGPGAPIDAGISVPLIRRVAGEIPLLGVCLGHQAIGEAFGGEIVRAGRLMHGKTSPIHHDGRGVFRGIPNPFDATRYHSLVIRRESLPECLEVTAETDIGEIMGVRHRSLPIEGVQFHPESILTEHGKDLLRNFIRE